MGDKHHRDQDKFLLENILLCCTPKFTNNIAFQLHNWQLHELNKLRRLIQLLCLSSQRCCWSSYLSVSTVSSIVFYFYFFLHYALAFRFVCPMFLVNSCRILVSLKGILKKLNDLDFLKKQCENSSKIFLWIYGHMVCNTTVLVPRFLRQKTKCFLKWNHITRSIVTHWECFFRGLMCQWAGKCSGRPEALHLPHATQKNTDQSHY